MVIMFFYMGNLIRMNGTIFTESSIPSMDEAETETDELDLSPNDLFRALVVLKH